MGAGGAEAAPPAEPVSHVAARGAATAVVRAEAVVVRLVGQVRVAIELGRVLDLVLRPVDVHRLAVEVDAVDDAGRDQHLLAEDPRPGVDDEQVPTSLVRGLVDLADAPVRRLDVEADEIAADDARLAVVRPDVRRRRTAGGGARGAGGRLVTIVHARTPFLSRVEVPVPETGRANLRPACRARA